MNRYPQFFSLLVAVAMVQVGRAGVVTHAGDSGSGSLRGEIAAAEPGGTVTFAPSLAGATIVLAGGQLEIDKNLTIDGSALPSPVRIDGNGAVTYQRVFRVAGTAMAVLDGLVITGGWTSDAPPGNPEDAGDGGGIHNAGVLTIRDSTIHGNTTGSGGDYVTFGGDGGGGGGIFNSGTLTVENCVVSGNTTGNGGDGIGSWFEYDDDYFDNGTYYGDPDDYIFELEGKGGLGGCGGGICNEGILTLRDTIVLNNTTGWGGDGVDNPDAEELDWHETGATADGGAGGAGGEGGGVYNVGFLRVEQSTVSGNGTGGGGHGANGTDGVAGLGGGVVQAWEWSVIEDATISGNTTAWGARFGGSGSGIFVGAGSMTVRNTTVAENRTGDGGFRGGSGAGIYHLAGTLTIESSTISDNTTGEGLSYPGGVGGIFTQSGTIRIVNSIVAGNYAGLGNPDFENGGSALTWVGGNLNGGNPMLAPLGYHGGPTQTMPPLAGSPAIDAGTAGSETPDADQRGLPRIVGGRMDIGSVESGNATGYDAWADARLPDGGDTAFAGDADGNGMDNGVEYACGPDGGLSIAMVAGAAELSFGYRPEAQVDCVLRVMRSADCRNFTEILRIAGGEAVTEEGISLLGGPSVVVLRDSNPPVGAVYYRLAVELAGETP